MTARPWQSLRVCTRRCKRAFPGWDGLLCWRTLPTAPRSQVTLLVLTLDLHVRAMEIQCCKHRLWRSSETHRTVVTYVTFDLLYKSNMTLCGRLTAVRISFTNPTLTPVILLH